MAQVRFTATREAAFWVLGLSTVAVLGLAVSYFRHQAAQSQFIITIYHIYSVETSNLPVGQTGIMIVVEIVNQGGPSVARNWQVAIQPQGGTVRATQRLSIPVPLPIPHDANNKRVTLILSDESLYNKTAVPIAQGGMAMGLVFAATSFRASTFDRPDTQFIVSCTDVYGRTYTAIKNVDSLEPGPSLASVTWPGRVTQLIERKESDTPTPSQSAV
jgi:hypothetical protein